MRVVDSVKAVKAMEALKPSHFTAFEKLEHIVLFKSCGTVDVSFCEGQWGHSDSPQLCWEQISGSECLLFASPWLKNHTSWCCGVLIFVSLCNYCYYNQCLCQRLTTLNIQCFPSFTMTAVLFQTGKYSMWPASLITMLSALIKRVPGLTRSPDRLFHIILLHIHISGSLPSY